MNCKSRANTAAALLSALTLLALCAPPVVAQNDKPKVFGGKEMVKKLPKDIVVTKVPLIVFNPLPNATSLDDFFNKLPNWSSARGKKKVDGDVAVGAPATPTVDEGGRKYNVVEQKRSITETPREIVMFAPAADSFYPGAILQEKGMRLGLGSQMLVPNLEGKRAPIKVSIVDGGGQVTVSDPEQANVSSAIATLKSQLNKTNFGSAAYYRFSSSENAKATALHIGANVRYMTAEVKGIFDKEHSFNQESINGYAVIKAYTVAALPLAAGWRGFFNNQFTLDDAKTLAKENKITPSNQPCYISSVTYGTIIAFKATRTLDEEEIKAKVRANAAYGFVQASAEVSGRSFISSKDVDVTFTGIGLPGQSVFDAVSKSGEEFDAFVKALAARAPTSYEVAPISYTVRALKDRSLASMQSTGEYTTTIVTPNPVGETMKLRLSFQITDASDGAANNNVECWATVRMDNRKIGGRDRNDPVTLEKNQTFNLAAIPLDIMYGNTTRRVDIRLYDRDGGSQDDELGTWSLDLNLAELAEKGGATYLGYERKNGTERRKSKMVITVERAGYL